MRHSGSDVHNAGNPLLDIERLRGCVLRNQEQLNQLDRKSVRSVCVLRPRLNGHLDVLQDYCDAVHDALRGHPNAERWQSELIECEREQFSREQSARGAQCGGLTAVERAKRLRERQLKHFAETQRRAGEASPRRLPDWKYSEGRILCELESYLASTYGQHYAGEGNVQVMDLIGSMGHERSFAIGNIIKYASRQGKKRGQERADILKILHYAIFLLHFHDKEAAIAVTQAHNDQGSS